MNTQSHEDIARKSAEKWNARLYVLDRLNERSQMFSWLVVEIAAAITEAKGGRVPYLTEEQIQSVWGVQSQTSGFVHQLDTQMVNAIIQFALSPAPQQVQTGGEKDPLDEFKDSPIIHKALSDFRDDVKAQSCEKPDKPVRPQETAQRSFSEQSNTSTSESSFTCGKCGEAMAFNVPRLGPDGGFVHSRTSLFECAPITPPAVTQDVPTPRTDANAIESRQYVGKGADFVSLDFARTLERELDHVKKLNEQSERELHEQDLKLASANEALSQAREELADKERCFAEFMDDVHKRTGAPAYEYGGQVIRDVGILKDERDEALRKLSIVECAVDKAEALNDASTENEAAASTSFNESMAHIVLEQTEKERDDLKAKNAELEVSRDGMRQELITLRTECEELSRNVKPAPPAPFSETCTFSELNALREKVREALAHWNQFQKAELNKNEKEAADWKQKGDMYRWNYHTGKHSGLILCDTGLEKLKKIDGAFASQEGKG